MDGCTFGSPLAGCVCQVAQELEMREGGREGGREGERRGYPVVPCSVWTADGLSEVSGVLSWCWGLLCVEQMAAEQRVSKLPGQKVVQAMTAPPVARRRRRLQKQRNGAGS